MRKLAGAIILVLIAAGLSLAYLDAGGAQPSNPGHPASVMSSPTTASSTAPTISSATTAISAGANWTSYHKDSSRSGYLPMNNISTVIPGWTFNGLDGQAYAEPLVVGQSVFVATENDSVYAVGALTGSLLWRTHLGNPVQGSSLPCGNIDPSGITSTPVIDLATGTLYAVAFLSPTHHTLFGLDINSGKVKSQVGVDPPGADPMVEQQRGALALANGVVYIPYGGLLGDCGNYHGWIVGVRTNGTGGLLNYEVPTSRGGGIWSPAGVSMAPNGDILVATGNSASTSSFDYGESVIRLSPTLSVLDYFAPANWANLNSLDRDLGSVAPTIIPNGDVFQVGKEGIGYLIPGGTLGGIGGQKYSLVICSTAIGGTARVGDSVLVPCLDGMVAINVQASNFSIAWRTPAARFGSPVVTGDVVWGIDTGSGELLGFNRLNGEQRFSLAVGPVVHFCTPAAGDDRLYVVSGYELRSFLLLP